MNKMFKVIISTFVENEQFFGSLCSYKSIDMSEPRWYLNINLKNPQGKKRFNKKRSLGYSTKEMSVNDPKLYREAKKILAKTLGTPFDDSEVVFSTDDLKFATQAKSIGRISEDKFKNLMMFNGYQVSTPVEDLWGYDFIVTNGDGKFDTVQVKSTTRTGKYFSLQSTKGIPYKGRVSHLACVHFQSQEIYYIPTNKLPENKATFVIDDSLEKYRITKYKVESSKIDAD